MSRSALVILSGGQDSTTCLYWAKAHFDRVHAITFDYNQRHRAEIEAAKKIAWLAEVDHSIIKLEHGVLGGRSPLTNRDQELETYSSPEEMGKIIGDRVELTFVPMRNALFLTIAANQAVCRDIYHMVTGVCQDDNANYPDCRLSFIQSQQDTVNAALGFDDPTKEYGVLGACSLDAPPPAIFKYDYSVEEKAGGLFIHTPLIKTPKDVAIRYSIVHYPDWFVSAAFSHTAYSGEYPPVTQDHATVLRADAFAKAGIPDPLIMRAYWQGLIPELPETDNYEGKVGHLITKYCPTYGNDPNEGLIRLGSALRVAVMTGEI